MAQIKNHRKKFVIVFGLLLASQLCIAQNGYNYPRPEVPLGGTASAIQTPSVSSAVRPVIGFPASSTSGSFPTASQGFGGTVGTTAPAFGFTTAQRVGSTFGTTGTGFVSGRPSPDIPTTGFPSTTGLGKRPSIPSRTSTIYSGTAATALGGPQEFPSDQFEGDFSAIPGEPGVNYPIYAQVPPTSFDCAQQQFPGYYSDVEAQCQVFHICALNRTYSFLCPNGTIFSQETLVCVWWNMFDCASAPGLYANNAFIYDYLTPTESRPASIGSGYTTGSLTSTGRGQSNFQAPGRTTTTGTGVFAANVRPTGPSTPFAGIPASVPPVATTAFPTSTTGTGRFTGATNTATGTAAFPTGPPATAAASPTAFGTTIRAGFSTIPDATFPSSQVSPTTSNREYLPPRRP